MTRLSEIHGPSQPSGRRPAPASMADVVPDQRRLGGLGQVALAFGVAAAMGGDFGAGLREGMRQLRAVAIHLGVDQQGAGQAQLGEHALQAPAADAIAIFEPGPVHHIGGGARAGGGDLLDQSFAEGIGFEVERHIDRQAPAARPMEVGARVDRRIIEAAVAGEHGKPVHGVMGPARRSMPTSTLSERRYISR